ncbi:pilus assembly protein [Acinetobacter faecalis]|uniref:pilus assembly protein n=1 Tax=Acinetobacter faecalis TaxID=2665161 RepID=UPI002A92077C|nr:PilC/PilY family type IV pilus protein [Acinetobacter faecalis]MDY6483453.1 PilC/PilY family type IV pilus protein [Acinetobacter faecalis]
MKSYLKQQDYPIKKFLTACVSSVMTGLICTSVAASDIDIYQNATAGDTTLMFMLDISGSMTSEHSGSDTKRIACELSGTQRDVSFKQEMQTPIAGGPTYRRQWCIHNNKVHLDRITRLKDGMIDLLYGNPSKGITKISDDKIIGISTLGRNNGLRFTDRNSATSDTGAILIPARKLGDIVGNTGKTQRELLINVIVNLEAASATPTARSYAETVAYLMGTTTAAYQRAVTNMPYFRITDKNKKEICSSWRDNYSRCSDWSSWFYWDNDIPLSATEYKDENGNIKRDRIEGLTTANCSGSTCYYLTGVIEVANSITGFPFSVADAKNGDVYQSPASLNQSVEGKQCSGQGVYVLTDGASSNDSNSLVLSQGALGSFGRNFTCDNSTWDCVNKLAASILNEAQNPKNLKFKTAVVGFGGSFNNIPSFDRKLTQQNNIDNINNAQLPNSTDAERELAKNIRSAARWGVLAEGGWYSGNSSQDVVDSVNSFLGDLGKEIPAVTTGTPEIPVDALIPSALQNYAYYPQFQPTPASASQIWLGNVKKYKVSEDGALVDKFDRLIADSKGRLLQTAADQLATPVEIFDLWSPNATAPPTDAERENALIGGAKLQLQLDQTASKERKILSTRNFSTKAATNTLQQFSTENLASMNLKKTDKAASLLELLGYQVKSTVGDDKSISKAELDKTAGIRFGAVMHSTPMLLTNGGQVTSENNVLGSKNRKDYILFGTTQGLLHVVDAETGVEKFAFVPNEMIEDQHLAFGDPNIPFLGRDKMFYGIDGQWTAYTEYVLDKDNKTLTVGAGRDNAVGTQLVYGGLRMGGRDYYALDLSDIDDPKLKFKISPSGACSAENPLGCMGQSWSKPTITHVNWEGKKKLVMLVGGGYDAGGVDGNAKDAQGVKQNYAGYESDSYEQINKRGAGVYMFDALTGSLLWWSSANATTSEGGYVATPAAEMKFSVVSPIKAVDRNSDGLSDHLFFGDLGGQVWRVDLNNDSAITSEQFAKAPVRLLNLGGSGLTRKRFYEAPGFSTYTNEGNKIFGVVSIGSGNRSLPLKDYTVGTNNISHDGVYNIYDKDVARSDLFDFVDGRGVYKYVPSDEGDDQTLLTTVNVTLQPENIKGITTESSKMLLNYEDANRFEGAQSIKASYGATQGWYYLFKSNKLQSEKVFATPIVINNDLYVTTFDASKPGSSGACGAGVKGESFITLFCMPYGQCKGTGSTDDYRLNLGAGIVGGALGAGDFEGMVRRIIATRDTSGLEGNEILKRKYQTGNRLIPQRWYVKQ